MKKFLFTALAAVCISLSVNAQKGSILVFGNVGYSHTSNLNNVAKSSTFNLNPGVGYQLDDKWTVGGEFGVGSSTQTINQGQGNSEYKQSSFSVGPFARYTYTISDIFSVFGQAGLGYQNATISDTKSNGMYAKLFPAVFINVKNGFGLNFDFGGLAYNSLKPSGGDSSNQFNFNFGKTINIGISKNF